MHCFSYIILACTLCLTLAQYDSPTPPRPIIPGAIPLGASPVGGPRPVLRRRPQAAAQEAAPPRRIAVGGRAPARRLPPPQLEQSLVSQRPSRPSASIFNDPIIRAPPQLPSPPPIPSASPSPLSQYSPQPAIQISPRPVNEDTEEEEENVPQQISFRPSPLDELPIPTRQQYRPTPQPVAQEEEQPTYVRQRPQPQPEVAVRQPVRQSPPRQQQQSSRGSPQPQYSRQQSASKQAAKEEPIEQPIQRGRKPQVQNIRKFREDNEDGSITWGFENDDGTYKEETIGVDCVTRGKYGYYSPDGIMREFTYESGIPCDKRDAETEETNEGYIDYSNNKYVFPNGDAIDLENMVKNKARKQPQYRN